MNGQNFKVCDRPHISPLLAPDMGYLYDSLVLPKIVYDCLVFWYVMQEPMWYL